MDRLLFGGSAATQLPGPAVALGTSIELGRDRQLRALWALQSLSSGAASELKTFWLKAGPWFVPGHAP